MPLPNVSVAKDLGVLTDRNLKFSSHIDVIVTKGHQRAYVVLNVGTRICYFRLLLLMSDPYSSSTVMSGLLLILCW